jgi:hypothetical protein
MDNLWGHSITYRIAVGPQAGRKVFTLQTLPACDVEESFSGAVGQVTGFSLHAGVAARAWIIVDNKLHLNYSLNIRTLLSENIPGCIVVADANWQGVLN